MAEELATSGLALKERAAKAAEECAAETSTRLREAMEAAGVPEETIEEQLRRQRADPTYVIPGFAMTASGAFAPIAQPGYPAVMQVIGPDGVPVPTHDPVPTPGQMPGIYSMYPHPAVDAAPINMEAHLAARAAAGYVHPDDRAKMAQSQLEDAKKVQQQVEAEHKNQTKSGEEVAPPEGKEKEKPVATAEDSAAAAQEGVAVKTEDKEKTKEGEAEPAAAVEEKGGAEETEEKPKTEGGGDAVEEKPKSEGGGDVKPEATEEQV